MQEVKSVNTIGGGDIRCYERSYIERTTRSSCICESVCTDCTAVDLISRRLKVTALKWYRKPERHHVTFSAA